MTDPQGAQPGSLGTFGGVFTPSILTILGLVLFLRVPYVVGSVGLANALLILGLSTAVSVLTTISLATLATNLKVRGGGEYFLISRTLGVEFGGAVGVVLYLAISVSVAFYAIGFAEALAGAFDRSGSTLLQLIAAGVAVVLVVISYIGSDLATRLQYVVMALLIVSLVSFFVGAIDDFDTDQLSDNVGRPDDGTGFWEAFAIFFPAVTGFSQGVAMSGDLRSPSRSITRGTFAAVGFSTVVYLAAVFMLAGAAPAATLVEETTTIMGTVSLAGWTILVGVLAATLSSSLASMLGGPRVLQRLAQDRVLPGIAPLEKGVGTMNNPRRAVLVTAVIAGATIALGSLNAVAPLISMFFLTSYGLINYATYYEIRAASTAFRPSFRWYDRRVSLLGTLACGGAIVAINPVAGAGAAAVLGGLYLYLRRRDAPNRWGNSAGAYHFTMARRHLRQLVEHRRVRDWRPCTLVFVPRDPVLRSRILQVAGWIEGGSGYTTAVRLVDGDGPRMRRRASQIEADLRNEVRELVPGSYARVLAVPEIESAVPALVQAHGIGDVRANLALFGVRDLRSVDDGGEGGGGAYGEMLHSCARLGINVAITNVDEHAWEQIAATPPKERSIALWWSDDQVGQLITLIAWLCKRDPAWSRARVIAHVPVSDDPDEHLRVAALLEATRIRAEVVEVEPSAAALADTLGSATLALAPLRVRNGRALGPFGSPLGMLLESLPVAVMVLATEHLDLDAEPDDEVAELIGAREEAERIRRWVAELDAAASSKLVEAERRRMQLEVAHTDDRSELVAAVDTAEADARTAFRAYLDAKSRLEKAEGRVADLAPETVGLSLDPEIWRSSTRT